MQVSILALGIIIGVLLCVFTALLILSKRNAVERIVKQTVSKLKPKGRIIEPENEDLQDFIENLPTEHDNPTE